MGDDLPARWHRLLREAGATEPDEALAGAGAALLARWDEPHRHYHDREHLAEVLDAVERLADAARDVHAVLLAAWFHDAVYRGRPGADEEASAQLAEQVLAGLGVPGERVAETARLVRMTAEHQPAPDDANGAVLSDADLAILAAPTARYARYVAGVRQEYAEVPDVVFRYARRSVLLALGEERFLYRTQPARDRWERAARDNVALELDDLDEDLPQ
jgi:predicted metal-dependent HD superfamily phosphohydrolase